MPNNIEANEYEKLLSAIENKNDLELLKHWYKRDDNSVPARYLLQPISSRIPHFLDNENKQLRNEAADQWRKIYGLLHDVLGRAADKALDPANARKYHMSSE